MGDLKVGGSTAPAPKTGSKKVSKGNTAKSTNKLGSNPAKNKPPAKNPSESANISGDAKKPEKPNAMAEGIKKNWTEKGLETSDGNKLGQYKKSGEGTIEKELLKKGFTMKEIYTKDKQGRTLAEQVAQTNGIKDMKKIADGKELTLPQLKGAQGTSSADLKPGEQNTIQAANANGDTVGKITQKKDDQGVTQTNLGMNNQGNNINVRQQTDGNATASIVPTANNGLREFSTQTSRDGRAVDTTQLDRQNNGGIGFEYKDIDGKKNTVATPGQGGLTLTNPDGQGRGNQTTVPLGPQSTFQSIAQKGDELGGRFLPGFFKPQQVSMPDAPIGQIGQVTGAQERDGSSRYTIRQADGNEKQVGQTASGRLLGAAQSIENTALRAWDGIKTWWNGSPPAGASIPTGVP